MKIFVQMQKEKHSFYLSSKTQIHGTIEDEIWYQLKHVTG